VQALVGENGAGKSTVVNLITHRLLPTAGRVEIVGHPPLSSPGEAIGAGIAAVYQDRKLAPNLTALENIFLGQELKVGGLLKRHEMRRVGEDILHTTLAFPPEILDRRLSTLTVPEQQAVAVAKAMLVRPSTMIFDEPSEALSQQERERLYALVKSLRDHNVAVLYITHALDELSQVADDVTVMRDGRVVGSGPISELPKRDIVRLMIGEELVLSTDRRGDARPVADRPIAEVHSIATADGRINGVSFDLFPGEVVGIAGLEGSGRGELLRAIVGLLPVSAGTVSIEGQTYRHLSPRQAWRKGVALVPRDRHREGVLPGLSVAAQISFASLNRFSVAGLVRQGQEEHETERIGTRLRLRAPSYRAPIEALSGGNQQKAVIGRALCANAKVWLLEEPTAAIDIRSRADVHTLLREFVRDGGASVVASSDAMELSQICDRVLVMIGGAIAEELCGSELNAHQIIRSQYGLAASPNVRGGGENR
jgi:ABC-type sugar transport system ATPase subunit